MTRIEAFRHLQRHGRVKHSAYPGLVFFMHYDRVHREDTSLPCYEWYSETEETREGWEAVV